MGEALDGWARVPGAVHSVGERSWAWLSGLPSADANMALVHGDDPGDLQEIVETIDAMGVPALLMCAGAGVRLAEGLGAGWSRVGSSPFMRADVASTPQHPDARVRRAKVEDCATFAGLLADSFEIELGICTPIARATLAEPGDGVDTWLLEHEGAAVSTVTTARVGDAVVIFALATPERFRRRGFARALLADAMGRAASEGAEVGLLSATPEGKPLYDATGWTTLEDWQIYTNGDSAQFH